MGFKHKLWNGLLWIRRVICFILIWSFFLYQNSSYMNILINRFLIFQINYLLIWNKWLCSLTWSWGIYFHASCFFIGSLTFLPFHVGVWILEIIICFWDETCWDSCKPSSWCISNWSCITLSEFAISNNPGILWCLKIGYLLSNLIFAIIPLRS